MSPTTRDDIDRLRRRDGDDHAADAGRAADAPRDSAADELPLPPPLPDWAIFWNRLRFPVALLLFSVLAIWLSGPLAAFSADAALVLLVLAGMAALLMFALLILSSFSWRDFESEDAAYYDDDADDLGPDEDWLESEEPQPGDEPGDERGNGVRSRHPDSPRPRQSK